MHRRLSVNCGVGADGCRGSAALCITLLPRITFAGRAANASLTARGYCKARFRISEVVGMGAEAIANTTGGLGGAQGGIRDYFFSSVEPRDTRGSANKGLGALICSLGMQNRRRRRG